VSWRGVTNFERVEVAHRHSALDDFTGHFGDSGVVIAGVSTESFKGFRGCAARRNADYPLSLLNEDSAFEGNTQLFVQGNCVQ